MVEQLYCIYDIKAEESGPVFTARNDQVAVRHTVKMLYSALNGMGCDDYILYNIASYDTEIMQVHAFEPRVVDYDAFYCAFSDQLLKIKEAHNETARS